MIFQALPYLLIYPLICAQRMYHDGRGIFAQEQIELQVYENATVGSVVIPDLRDYLQVSPDRQIRLGPGSLGSFFSLTQNYTLLVQSDLDLESGELCRAEESCCRSEAVIRDDIYLSYTHFTPNCKLKAVVLANAGGSTPLKPIGRIVVVIRDLNDHAPEFVLPKGDAHSVVQRIHIPFFEGFKGVGERFQLPTAKDQDFLPENSVVTYSLTKLGVAGFSESSPNEILASNDAPTWQLVGPFRLVHKRKEDSLALEVARELDRETQSEYELVLHAADGEGKKASLILHVHVLDVNEYAPTFVGVKPFGAAEISEGLESNTRVVHLYENASIHTPFVQVIAEDKDAPPANRITYKFANNFHLSEAASVFSIDPNNGLIRLEKPLDYERIKRYVLPVLAIDASYEPTFGEEKALTQAAQKVAQEIAESIKKEPKTSTMTLEVRVNDCNDHAPEIKLQGTVSNAGEVTRTGIEELTVVENSPPGTSLVFFSAVDRDQGDAGATQCHLLNWTEYFRIHNFSDFFGLETSRELDREVQPEYLITIECSDNGSPRQFSQKRLRVVLLDVNDEEPSFQHPVYSFHVLENSPPMTKLIPVSDSYKNPVTAFDKDTNSTLTYHLEPSMLADSDQSNMFDYQLFDVDSETGTLYTKSALDREQKSSHKFSLCANDGVHKACTNIIVHLDDVNDNPPLFDRETHIIRLVENTQIYEPLITFNVADVDIGNQGFTFTIEAPQLTTNESDSQDTANYLQRFFNIRDNRLFLRQPLDREAKAHYHFFVRVADLQKFPSGRLQESLSSTTEVFIEVSDINDNVPVFIFPNTSAANDGGNQLNVSCRETMGSSVGRVEAIDLDLGQNGTVVYSVIQGPVSNELFYLDKQSGELFVNSGSLSENCDSVFLLVISADDMGPPSSKKGRPLPVERLLIRLQDQPTLAEYMSLNSQQPSSARGSDGSRGDAGYFGLPAKTMLSVVLGGCIVFLTGLFLAWVILMLISRSKRRRCERSEDAEYQAVAAQCFEAATLHPSGKHDIFVHPSGTFARGLGLTATAPVLQYTLGAKEGSLEPRDLNVDETASSRASPCGQSIGPEAAHRLSACGTVGQGGRKLLSGILPCPSIVPSGGNAGRLSRASPFHTKPTVNLSSIEASFCLCNLQI
uniref:Protocadherin-1 n=1 Tax=Mesocestoides corti TaxID=53468 RepID=A0A5K3FP61_MESCO